jgi:group I intron endonuclease
MRGRKGSGNRISGVYKIQSKVKPNRIYIGSAVNIHRRWWDHLHRLKENVHENPKLQNHYNKYGKTDLIFSIIISCEKDVLLETEQFFIDAYKPWFNICKKAGSVLGRTAWNKGMRGQYHRTKGCYQKGHVPWSKGKKFEMRPRKKHSEEHKEKIRKSMMGKKNALKKK